MTRIGLLITLAGIACLLAFRFIGATVDGNGLLHEPFALLPVGYGLLFIGACFAILGFVRSKRGRHADTR